MVSKRMFVPLTVLVASMVVAGCGGDGDSDSPASVSDVQAPSRLISDAQVGELKSKIEDLPFKAKLNQNASQEKRGLLVGTMAAKDGTKAQFAVRLGDDPERELLRDVERRVPRRSIGRGTVGGISYAVSSYGRSKNFRKRHRMRTKLVEAACLVNTGEACDWLGTREEGDQSDQIP